MDTSVNKLFVPNECLGNVHSFQSNLIQVVNEYLQNVVKEGSIRGGEIRPILESLTLLLPVVPALSQPAAVFLSAIENPFEQWLSQSDLKPWVVLYRLLPYVVDRVRGIWNWESLFRFLSCDHVKVPLLSGNHIQVRFYATQIVCILLDKTEKERRQMESLLGVDPSSVYQSTALMDLQKAEKCYQETVAAARKTYLQANSDSDGMQEEPSRTPIHSVQYVEVCGFILPCNSRERTTGQPTSELEPFVLTETSRRNLQNICLQMQDSTPVLLQGPSGCGKTRLFQELAHLTHNDDYVQLYLDDQTDSKTLIGNYVCTDVPGEFVFQPGTLTQSIAQGKWIIIEDIDKVPFDIVSTLLPIIEKGELAIASRGITVPVHPNFRLFGTSCHNCAANNSPINSFLSNHWHVVDVQSLSVDDLRQVMREHFPSLTETIQQRVLATFQLLCVPSAHEDAEAIEKQLALLQELSATAVSITGDDLLAMKAELLRNGKPVTSRDILKWCTRMASNAVLTSLTTEHLSEKTRKLILDEALDVFAGCLPAGRGRMALARVLAAVWNLSAAAVEGYVQTAPAFELSRETLTIGRVQMPLAADGKRSRRFYRTKQSLRLMEQICVCIKNREPMLLVGETGCGKTTVIQYVAELMGQELVVLNMNEQTQCSDLVGGFKPVDLRQLAIPLYNRCCELFNALFMDNKHPTFKPSLKSALDTENYKELVARFRNFIAFASSKIVKAKEQSQQAGRPTDKYERWSVVLEEYYASVVAFEKKVQQVEDSFAFSFVPGALVDAIEKGKWVLLDELNLAPGEVLQRLSGLLEGVSSSLVLSERGDVTPIRRHPNFRIFAAMNPATDVGKKALAPSVRNRFSEFYVDELTDKTDLELIVRSALESSPQNDVAVASRIVEFYLLARAKAESQLVDGGNKSPRYSLRTLCRALDFVNHAGDMKLTFRVALFEGLCMSFLTMLDIPSQQIMRKLIQETVFFGGEVVSMYPSRNPGGSNSRKDDFVLVNRYWLPKGESECVDLSQERNGQPPRFILTESVKNRLDDLCRAVLMHTCPVLLQGPTSSGKTSMITYLAALTGHRCVRINNHEYTDLQDYTGIYVSSPTGQLVFHEGLLVEALRNGYWVILDELNLAPSEVLEALNRLLDDNRELYIPETNTVVRPHPNFMLFATQNPPGKYGGRKVLSRAFRNRFLEMHVEDLPAEELQVIIQKRSRVCERFAREMIQVMQRLQIERMNSNVFAGKDGFITPRDLLRWGSRRPNSSEELAYHGYLLLAERLRREDERAKVRSVIEEVCKVKIDLEEFYLRDAIIDRMMDSPENEKTQLWNLETLKRLRAEIQETYASDRAIPSGLKSIAITGTLQKMFKMIGLCLHYDEPVLLVGGTGCGKTTAVQLVAQALRQRLVILNCHAHTETSDIIGGQRPSRSHETDATLFKQVLLRLLPSVIDRCPVPDVFPAEPRPSMEALSNWVLQESPSALMTWISPLLPEVTAVDEEHSKLVSELREVYARYQTIFSWQDGPLLSTMKNGDIFLLDEISLAEDAVLERMNSVLENERQITVPEKGGDCIESITAAPAFRLLATMNPGGDFGKKELSAALRNRFTEIWVSPLNGLEDLKQIMNDRVRMHERSNPRFPAVSEEVQQRLVTALLPFVDRILAFVDFFNATMNANTTSSQNRTEATCRDILSIIDFMKLAVAHLGMTPYLAFAEALQMILLDGLGIGTNLNSAQANEYKARCFEKMMELIPAEEQTTLRAFYGSRNSVLYDGQRFGVEPYTLSVLRQGGSADLSDYHFAAPTTCSNLKRVLRALQLHKPILLEGSPGVGKTSLIMAVAQVIGQPIVRVNLSEQTDMADLLGSDLPVPAGEQATDEAGNSVQFRWSDGVLLSAIKSGAWVLLDELNLASQQVLEGLNSCLDHRATVYIPEIDKEFQCPSTFQIFACQNPLEEGGGRKGLPRSFINRFARVYVDTLKETDMMMIGQQLLQKKIRGYYGESPCVDETVYSTVLQKMVSFIVQLDAVQNRGRAKNVNSFEFNLRDIFRWCDLMLANQNVNEWHPEVFLSMLFLQRMRDSSQRERALALFNAVFGLQYVPPLFPPFHITDATVQIGNAISRRINRAQATWDQPLLRQSLPYLESLLFAVQNKLPCLLIGDSGSGKSYALHTLSGLLNVRLYEYNMNTTTDATEILGCFEQVEASRHYSRLLGELVSLLQGFLWRVLVSNCSASHPAEDRTDKRLRVNSMGDTHIVDDAKVASVEVVTEQTGKRSFEVSPRSGAMLEVGGVSLLYTLISYLQKEVTRLLDAGREGDANEEIEGVVVRCRNDLQSLEQQIDESYVAELQSLLQPAEDILKTIAAIRQVSSHVSFEWIDGSLIEAIVRGYWVVFDNANFCSASVLDRLNSLLENNGSLLINECGLVNGKERVIHPHNDFRIFFVMNPSFGEISRAMRNRCVEIFFPHPLVPSYGIDVPSNGAVASLNSAVTSPAHQLIPAELWDEFDIVNACRVDDFNLIVLVLQTYSDIRKLFASSLLRLNARYLQRFAALVVEQLERGCSVEKSLQTAGASVFNSPLVSEYLKSAQWYQRLQSYRSLAAFCEKRAIPDDLFLSHHAASLKQICNEASDVQVLRESVLLNYLIRMASAQRLSEDDFEEWLRLFPEDADLQRLMGQQHALVARLAQRQDAGLYVVAVCLLFMRSKPNLHHIEVVLTPSVHDAATADSANVVLTMVREALNAIRNSRPYQRLKEAQQSVHDYLRRGAAAVSRDHISLFSNNFDAAQLCSPEELFAQFPLFVASTDPVLVQLRKTVANVGLLSGDHSYRAVLQQMDTAVRHMSVFATLVPLLTAMALEAQRVSQNCRGRTLNTQTLGEYSVLEVSLLLSQGMLDATQVQNKTVASAVPLIATLVQALTAFIEGDMAAEDTLLAAEYVSSLLQLFRETRYAKVLSSATAQQYNTQLVAFLHIFNSAFAHFRAQFPAGCPEESVYRSLVATILEELRIRSNISMDNKLWLVAGRPLMAFKSEAFSLFMQTLGQVLTARYVYTTPVTPNTLRATLSGLELMTAEEKKTVVEALATLNWLSHTDAKELAADGLGVVSVSQLREVLAAVLEKSAKRLEESVSVVDTTFQGSVELGEEGASEVVLVNDEAYGTYERLMHDVAVLKESQLEQVRLLPLLFRGCVSSLGDVYSRQLQRVTSSPEQLLALQQVRWLLDSPRTERVKLSLPASQMEYLRLHLENYWSDYALGARIAQEDELLQKDAEQAREEATGPGLALTPHTAVNVHRLLAPLFNVRGQSVKNSRDRVEFLGVFKSLLRDLSLDLGARARGADVLQSEAETIWEVVFFLLLHTAPSDSDSLQSIHARGLTQLRVEDITRVEETLQRELAQAADVTSMRFESLCLAVLPCVLHLLGLLQASSDRLLSAVVVSECWLGLGLLQFYLLLPSSILDPLLQDYVEGHLRQLMNGNLADMLFILSYQGSLLGGDLHKAGASAPAELQTLYETVLSRNKKAVAELQQGVFEREGANSFDQLYATLYSFGSSILSLTRLYGLQQRALCHLLGYVRSGVLSCASEVPELLGRVQDVVSTLFRQLQASPFVISDAPIQENHDADVARLLKEGHIFQSNVHSFKQSLQRSYGGYRDVIAPVKGATAQIQHGLAELLFVASTVSSQLSVSLGNGSLHYRFLQAFTQYPFHVLSADYRKVGAEMTALMNMEPLRTARVKSLVFRSLLTQLLLFNLTVLRRTTAESAISDFISSFTDLFNAQKEEEAKRRAEEEKAVEFRTRTIDIENISSNEEAMEAAFKEQFPDYQLLFDEEAQAQAIAQGDSLDLAALEKAAKGEESGRGSEWVIGSGDIAYVRDVMNVLVAPSPESATPSVREQLLFLNGSIASSLEREIGSLALSDYETSTTLFLLLEMKLGKEVTEGRDLASILRPSRGYSFHNHSNVVEAEHCAAVLIPLKRRVFDLLRLYPTHVVLQYLCRLVDRMLEMPIVTPLSVMLSGVEVLSHRMHDWEVSAAQAVSLAEHIRQVNQLIIRWRRLELQSWSSFLDDEDEKAAQKTTDYFCQLYSLLLPQDALQNSLLVSEDPSGTLSLLSSFSARVGVRPQDLWVLVSPASPLSHIIGLKRREEDSEAELALKAGAVLSEKAIDYTQTLIEILDAYMRGSQLLEFSSRLQLLLLLSRFLKLQLEQHRVRNSVLELNMNVLYHTTRMYSVFLPSVQAYIQTIRGPIEKQLKDQVKLGKWDDQSYFSLRETANKIHRQLFKLVYEYRDANNLKVSVVLDKVLDEEFAELKDKDKEAEPEKEVKPLRPKDAPADATPLHPELESLEDALLKEDASLQELASLRHRDQVDRSMRQLIAAPSMAFVLGAAQPAASLEDLATTIIVTAAELREEKKFTARKQKAFASLLSHLKEEGVSPLKSTIPAFQQQYHYIMRLSIPEMRSIPAVVKSLAALSASTQQDLGIFTQLWTKADQYFYKDHLLLSALRMQVSQQVSDQLTAADVRRCVGYTENLMLFILQEREALLSLSAGILAVNDLLKHADHIASDYRDLQCLRVAPVLEEVAPALETLLTSTIEVVSELLFFGQRVGGDVKVSAAVLEACEEAKRTLEAELERLTVRDASSAYRLYAITNPDLFLSTLTCLQNVVGSLLQAVESQEEGVLSGEQLQVSVSQWRETLVHVEAMKQRVEKSLLQVDPTTVAVSASMQEVLKTRNRLVARLQLIVQSLRKQSLANQEKSATAESSAFTFQQTHNALLTAWNALSLGAVQSQLDALLEEVLALPGSELAVAVTLLPHVIRLVKQVLVEAAEVLVRGVVVNKGMGKLEYVLLRLFREILKKGFCLPPKEEEEKKKQEEGMQEGTGMGDGEGEEDVTDQLESKEQLDGLKGEKEEQKEEEKEEKEENTGMDVEDDFDGELQNVKEDEEDEEEEEDEDDRDREMGDLDEDDDQEVLDEKLWDPEEEEEPPAEDEKIEQDTKQQNEKNTDEMTTKEDDQEPEKKEDEGEQKEEQEMEQAEEQEKDEINDLNEQEYEDDHFKNQQEEEEEEEMPENMEIEDEDGEEQEDQEMGEEEEAEEMDEQAEEETAQEEEEEQESEGESIEMAGDAEEEKEEDEEEDDREVDENPEEPREEEKEEAEKLEKEKQSMPPTEGVADTNGEDQVLDAPKEKEEGAREEEEKEEENNPGEEQEETPEQEGAQEKEEEQEGEGGEKKEEEEEVNPYKNPEQTKKQWEQQYERLQMVPQEEEEESAQQEEMQRERQPLSEQVKQETSGQEVLAPSLQDVDFKPETEETNRVEMDAAASEEEEEREETNVEYEKEMEEENPSQPPFPESESEAEEAAGGDASNFASEQLERVMKEGAGDAQQRDMLQGIMTPTDVQAMEAEAPIRLPFVEEDSYLNMDVQSLLASPTSDAAALASASAAWKEFLSQTADLSGRLTEQLRLLMEPTKASKLSGDFKTGKRINMRKVIPFIASNYRKDKIWLRRSRPSAREYQILLAIDDSESMRQNDAGTVTFKTLALLGNALMQLEVGQIGVVSFGESVQYVHPLTTPFTAQSGAQALTHFGFSQKHTDFEACLQTVIAVLAQARQRLSGAAKRAVQLAFVVSDGRIQGGRDRIAKLVRDAEENNILVVLLIVDDTENPQDSILKTKVYTGKKGHLFANYLDNYPFPYYLVIRSIQTLPEILSDTLTQWFEMINSRDD